MNDAGNKINKHRDAAQPEPRSGEERKQREEQLSLLQTITMEVAAAGDLSAALEVVLRRVCEKTGWAFGQAWVPNQDETLLVCGPAWLGGEADSEGIQNRFRRIAVSARGSGLPGRVWSSKQPAWIEDVTLDANFPRIKAAAASGTQGGRRHSHSVRRSSHRGDRVFPARVAGRERAPGEGDHGRGRAVGSRHGTESARKRNSRARTKSSNPFLSNMGDAVIVADTEGKFLVFNPAAERMFGKGATQVASERMVAAIRPLSCRTRSRLFPHGSIAADALDSR